MPRKKLTKAQVKRKYKSAFNPLYDLYLDKLGHPDSFNPVSKIKADRMLDDVYKVLRKLGATK